MNMDIINTYVRWKKRLAMCINPITLRARCGITLPKITSKLIFITGNIFYHVHTTLHP